MLEFSKKKEAILNCTNNLEKMKNFFSKGFDKFNLDDQSKIIEIFETYMKRNSNGNDWNKYLRHHPDIIERLIKIINMPICLENENININTKSRLINSFLNIIYYTPYNDMRKEDTLNKVIQYLYENYKEYNLNTLGTNISIILKNIKDFTHGKLIPEKFEEIIIYYLNNINYSYICDNEVFHLLIESSANINYSKIKNIIYSKIKGDDPANKYIIERMSNKYLCYESCMEILSNERFSNSIRRMAIVDYLKNFLKTNGVKESTVIYDDQLYREGEAIGKLIKINSNQLNITCFHEAIHIIQHNDFEQEKYYGNRYYMLKDEIIKMNIPDNVYRSNYPSFLFEEEAEILGEIHSLQYQQKNGKFDEGSKERLLFLLSKEIKAIDTININGEEIKKEILLDSIIKMNPNLLNKYPILKVEYNIDGIKKDKKEIIESINNLDKSEEEKQAIYSCIFERKYEKSSVEALKKETSHVK